MIYPACLETISATYAVPKMAIQAVIAKSHGSPLAPIDIPASWQPILERIGFDIQAIHNDPCTNIAAGAWIMAYEAMTGHTIKLTPAPSPPLHQNVAQGGVAPGCVEAAAKANHVQLTLLQGILATEGGHVGQIHRNENGSFDMGPAQVNSIWLPQLAVAGITKDQLINDGCLNVSIGAWILAQAMKGADPSQPAQFWEHVGDYNSATPVYNQRYALLVWNHISQSVTYK